jgi:lysophospholipase L1-like esterase
MQPTMVTEPNLSTGKKIFFSIFLLAAGLALGEFGSTLLLRRIQGYDGEHLLQYVFDPYKNLLPTPNYVDVRGVHHNAAGFRRTGEVSRTPPPNTYRIFLMGASTAYGTGGLWPHLQREYAVLADSVTISAYLERLLDERLSGVGVEVINAGIPSTWTHHDFIYLNQSVLRYNPDMILFLDGFNDFYFFGEDHDQFADYAYQEHSTVIMGPPTVRALISMNAWWLFRKSALAHVLIRSGRNLKRLVTPQSAQPPIDVDVALERVESVFRNNALKMMERSSMVARHEGVIPVFMLQPLLVLERERPGLEGIERDLFEFNVNSYRPNYEEFMRRAVPRLAQVQQEQLAEVGGEFIDLTGIFSEAEGQIFTDYAHLTPRGNEILARYVLDRIMPMIQADLSTRPGLESASLPEAQAEAPGSNS